MLFSLKVLMFFKNWVYNTNFCNCTYIYFNSSHFRPIISSLYGNLARFLKTEMNGSCLFIYIILVGKCMKTWYEKIFLKRQLILNEHKEVSIHPLIMSFNFLFVLMLEYIVVWFLQFNCDRNCKMYHCAIMFRTLLICQRFDWSKIRTNCIKA